MTPSIEHHRICSPDGIALAVVDGGVRSAPPILFIHGFLFSAAAFALQFKGALARRHRLIGIDLRGHGGSDKPRDVAAYADARTWADDVACVLESLDVGRAIIVGWSLGSRVALNYAWRYGFGRIAGLNLVGATLASGSHGPDAGLPPQWRDLLATDTDARRDATRRFVDECAAPLGADARPLEAFTETAMGVPVEARLGSKCWPIPYDDDLSWISVPTLITHGALDRLVSEQTARAQVEAIPNAELALITGGGHLAFFQQCEQYDNDLAGHARRCFSE